MYLDHFHKTNSHQPCLVSLHLPSSRNYLELKSYEAEKTSSRDQNKKSKMRFYFISSFNSLFKAIHVNTLQTLILLHSVLQWKDVPSELYRLESSLWSYHRYIFIFSVFSSFYFIFPFNCPEGSTNKPYKVNKQETDTVHSKDDVRSVPKMAPRCTQTSQERHSVCKENKHPQISTLSYSKMPGSYDPSTGKTPEDSHALS